MSRYLPPLVLAALLAFVLLRACERPSREAARARIERQWDASTDQARNELSIDADRYLEQFQAEDDRLFAAKAQLRARYVDKAVLARFGDLDKPVSGAAARGFAQEALDTLAWDDAARTRPSMVNDICLLALVESGDPDAQERLLGWLTQAPLGELYGLIRRGGGLQEPRVRQALARGCRERAAHSRVQGLREEADDWDLIGSILALRAEEYAEREADVDRLLRTLDERFRAEYPPRWTMGMIALGGSSHPRAMTRLREQADALAQGSTTIDLRDLALVSMALLAGDDWERAEVVRQVFDSRTDGSQLVRAFLPDILADLWNRGNDRALEVIADLWEGPAAEDAGMRVQLARALLFRTRPPSGRLTPERLVAALQRPDAPAPHVVVALGYRMKSGDAAARQEILRLLTTGTAQHAVDGAEKVSPEASARRAATATVTALRMLLIYN